MNIIKFAVVGCGHIGKRHAQIIAEHPQAKLTALIDIKQASELNIHAFNIPFFSSLNNFFQSAIETDVIIIATPNGLHAQQAIECLQHDKHVVIEKPMALHAKDAQDIVDAAMKYQKQVFIVKQNRYSPPVAWLKKEIVDKNILGRIYSVQMNCFWNRDERYYTKDTWHGTKDMDGGTLFTQFSHFIDIFYWLFGDIGNITSTMRSFNHKHLTMFEDSGIVTFDFGDSSLGCLNFSTAVWDKNFESSLTIIGENGTIKIGGQYMDKLEYCHIKNYVMPVLQSSHKENDYEGYKGSANNHAYVIQNVIDVLHNKTAITANATEGMKVVDIIERIYKAGNS
ncbi:MAG TPA: Gfo/Idh/MocA family oxidoreductase [Parafilimonas sp.]|nr:Gfo/Idh/MocA family oxidoreductase [Parafilimonas sp.]